MNIMDVDTLITAVFKKPSIWDKRRKDHANRNVVDKAWKDISKEMNVEEAILRKKWKNMRDYFAIEYSKRPMQRSGDGGDNQQPVSKWQYFNQLLFLKDIVAPRMSSGSLESLVDMSPSVQDSENTTVDFESQNPNTCVDQQNLQTITPDLEPQSAVTIPEQRNPKQRSGSKRKCESVDPFERMVELEQKKIEMLAEKEDDDLLWLKSLLPYIKRIPEERRLSFRSRIHIILEEFAYHGRAVTNLVGNYDYNDQYQQLERQSAPSVSNQSSCSYHGSPGSYHSYEHQYLLVFLLK